MIARLSLSLLLAACCYFNIAAVHAEEEPEFLEVNFEFQNNITIEFEEGTTCRDRDKALIMERIDRFLNTQVNGFFNEVWFQDYYGAYTNAHMEGLCTDVEDGTCPHNGNRRMEEDTLGMEEDALEKEYRSLRKRQDEMRRRATFRKWAWGPFFTYGYCFYCPRDDNDGYVWLHFKNQRLLQGGGRRNGGGGRGERGERNGGGRGRGGKNNKNDEEVEPGSRGRAENRYFENFCGAEDNGGGQNGERNWNGGRGDTVAEAGGPWTERFEWWVNLQLNRRIGLLTNSETSRGRTTCGDDECIIITYQWGGSRPIPDSFWE